MPLLSHLLVSLLDQVHQHMEPFIVHCRQQPGSSLSYLCVLFLLWGKLFPLVHTRHVLRFLVSITFFEHPSPDQVHCLFLCSLTVHNTFLHHYIYYLHNVVTFLVYIFFQIHCSVFPIRHEPLGVKYYKLISMFSEPGSANDCRINECIYSRLAAFDCCFG